MKRKAGVVMAAAFIAIAAAACGSATDDGGGASIVAEGEEALELVANAPDVTLGEHTTRFEGTVEVSIDGDGFTVRMEGVQDFVTGAGDSTMVVPLSDVIGTLEDLRTEMIRPSAGTTYMNFGDLLELPDGKEWVLITADDLGLPPEEALGGEDPTAGLDFLRGVVENPRPLGSTETRGDSVDRYLVEVDFVALFNELAEEAEDFAPSFAAQAEVIDELIDGPLDGEVWIDEEGRVRRFVYDMRIDERGTELEITATTDYFDFGVAVEPSVPDPSDVVDFDEVEEEVLDFFGGAAPGLSG